jgi:hypothetical protein
LVNSLRRALRLALFDRRVATELMFDRAAIGDAVLLVAGLQIVISLVRMVRGGGLDLVGLIAGALYAVVGWLILSFAIWLMGTKLLGGSGDPQSVMRVSGFGVLPTVLALAGSAGALLGLGWRLAILVLVVTVVLGLGLKESVAAVVLGGALVVLLQLIFRAPFLAF